MVSRRKVGDLENPEWTGGLRPREEARRCPVTGLLAVFGKPRGPQKAPAKCRIDPVE